MLTKVPEIPLPASEPTADYMLLCGEGSSDKPHLLLYEIARDFLSAPRSFAIVELVTITPGAIELDSDNEYDQVEYDEAGVMTEKGIFVVDSDGEEDGSDEQHIVVSLASQRIELLVRSFKYKQVVVEASSQVALANYLLS